MTLAYQNDIPIPFSKQTNHHPNRSCSSSHARHRSHTLLSHATKPRKHHKPPNPRHRSLLGHQPHQQSINDRLGQHRTRHKKEHHDLRAQHRQHQHTALNEHRKLDPHKRLKKHNTNMGLPKPNTKPKPATQNNLNPKRRA